MKRIPNGAYASAQTARTQGRREINALDLPHARAQQFMVLYLTVYGWGWTRVGSAHHFDTFTKNPLPPFRDDGNGPEILEHTEPEAV